MRRATEFMEAATDLLKRAGVTYKIEHGKHLRIRWIFNGQPRLYVMTSTSSDINAIRNIRTQLRRMLRQDEVLQ